MFTEMTLITIRKINAEETVDNGSVDYDDDNDDGDYEYNNNDEVNCIADRRFFV